MPRLPTLPFESSRRREHPPWKRPEPPRIQYWSLTEVRAEIAKFRVHKNNKGRR